MPGHRLCRTPYADGASPFLNDPKRRQKSRWECDSPLPTPVGMENRTFPGQQPRPVLRYQCKKPGVLLNRYGYFSFGSGARERPHRAARELRASRGEASGPPADAETYILTVQLFIRVAASPNRRSSRVPSNLFVWPRRQEEAGTATHPRRTDAASESHRARTNGRAARRTTSEAKLTAATLAKLGLALAGSGF